MVEDDVVCGGGFGETFPSPSFGKWFMWVIAIEGMTVYLTDGDDDFDLHRNEFIRLFGVKHLRLGQYCVLIIKNGRLRGWPWVRRWTAADIALAEEQARVWARSIVWE
jgi:hypothetical protein